MLSLFNDGVATQSELEQAQLRLEAAQIGLQSAQDQADAASAQAEAYHTNAMAAGDQAGQISEMIDDGTLRAPYSGRIVRRNADPGTIVGPGTPVFEIVGEGEDVGNRYEVRLNIPESISSKVQAGTPIYVKLPSCEEEIQTAVDHMNSVVQTDTRTIEVVAYISSDTLCALPGVFGTVRIPLEVHENAILLPETAVLVFPDVSLVYVAVNNAAIKKEVATGILEGGKVEILSGLDPNDDVIVVGNRFLADGASIEVRDDGAGSQTPDTSDTTEGSN
jgi:RND family efflux transporter MFP subunit